MRKPFFPLAQLMPLTILAALGITAVLLVNNRPEFANVDLHGLLPSTSNAILQKVIYFLGNTNLGVVTIIIGLIIAALLATLNHRANLTVRQRKKELGAFKKTPVASYET